MTASLAKATAWTQVRAQDNSPNRRIALWVPWPAGGATDLTMRLLAELRGKHWGQKIVIENSVDAGGTLAMPVLQQPAPDGCTIAQMPQPMFRALHTQKNDCREQRPRDGGGQVERLCAVCRFPARCVC